MVLLEGPLSKWTNVMKGWQFRWFVLEENSGLLSYYTSKEKMMKGVRRGCVRLKGAVIGIDDQDANTFTITVDHKTFHFQAKDGEEREKWVRHLEDTILRHASRSRGIWASDQSSLYANPSGAYASNLGETTKRSNYLQTLDRRINEADTYLQLMIEQTNKIERKLASSSSAASASDPEKLIKENKEVKEANKLIIENANAMLESFKHSIVLLQIAKNTAHPINGVYQGPQIIGSVQKSGSEMTDQTPDSLDLNAGAAGPSSLPSGLVEYGAECIERKLGNAKISMDTSPSSMTLQVPETSYSSSEGEDDFYDANDKPFSSSVSIKEDEEETQSVHEPIIKEERHSPRHSITPFRSDGSLDYDALYEENDSDNNISMESHGSVVTHLLSQVKIGMDLTKVVLPTFILERRSLLEMYADYFAHPDLFLKVVDLKDPRDRMVQIVRWYLSSYHAGRKSAVAKKPYNPVLGEVFKCHWDLPSSSIQQKDSTLVNDGPVPWCHEDQLTFVAEQVCHHPPISAFYAEHYNKRISFSGHVWTKSKFLGLSIGVHNIGHGTVTLCDLNEEYILTFPNGYGRSILTVPWIELGGEVTITCPQTGYRADIEFLTKPFYGGKRNKITAEVYAPNEKKSFLSIAGEWSGCMEAKFNDGHKSTKPEVFIDVNKIPVFKKIVRPIVEQEENESRRIWLEVTAGLRLNDIERATHAKCLLEQKQREEAKLRKETNSEWETKYFRPVGDSWIYATPLSQRLYLKEKQEKSDKAKN